MPSNILTQQHTIKKRAENSPISTSPISNYFYFPSQRGKQILYYNEILYLKSESNYTYIFFSDGRKILLSKTLKHLIACLPDSIFLRTHQSYVVNKTYVNKFQPSGLLLKDDSFIPISRRFYKNVVRLNYGDN
jgi:two-component system, LytTR family, response regulator